MEGIVLMHMGNKINVGNFYTKWINSMVEKAKKVKHGQVYITYYLSNVFNGEMFKIMEYF